MTPAARVQAAIEILDAVIAAAKGGGASADRIAADWFRTHRFAGSKDRRAIRDLAWAAIRKCGEIPQSGRAALLLLAAGDEALAGLFSGEGHGPAPVVPGEELASAGTAPRWLAERLAASGLGEEEQAALLGRAPLDLRVNTLKAGLDELAAALPQAGERVAGTAALRFPPGTPAESWPQFAAGLFEVQDAGSQLACAMLGAMPGETVVDLCAGAGGKTLALAAAMDNRGTLVACDIDRARLSRLPARADRAGAQVETRLLDPKREEAALADLAGRSDAVLVDAPCSGTGTWRRNPEARWRIGPQALDRYAAMQDRVLDIAAGLVRPGGRIGFITCSLLDQEGTERVAAFLARHRGWVAETIEAPLGRRRGDGWRLTPHHDGTDGFFFARLHRL